MVYPYLHLSSRGRSCVFLPVILYHPPAQSGHPNKENLRVKMTCNKNVETVKQIRGYQEWGREERTGGAQGMFRAVKRLCVTL